LHETVERYVIDDFERRLIEPGLAALIGLSRRPRAHSASADHEDPFNVGVVAVELLESGGGGPESEALLAQARDNFERLGAIPWPSRARVAQRAGAAA
jgi:hypothetical protein